MAYLRDLQCAEVGLIDAHEGRKALRDIIFEPLLSNVVCQDAFVVGRNVWRK